MFGPPSSPPPALTKSQENEIQSALLPAFDHDEPSGSSSSAVKYKPRQVLAPKFTIYHDENASQDEKTNASLPTPLPTSEANAQESSPPPSSPQYENPLRGEHINARLNATRAALQQLIVIRVPISGAAVTIGRSSKSSNFVVKPSNRLASRVHAKLSFSGDKNLLMIECLGWNGLSVNVPSESHNGTDKKSYDVKCGQILNIEKVDGVTMDIHGDKALIEYVNDQNASELTEDESWSQSDPVDLASSEANASPAAKRVRVESEDNKENQYIEIRTRPDEQEDETKHSDASKVVVESPGKESAASGLRQEENKPATPAGDQEPTEMKSTEEDENKNLIRPSTSEDEKLAESDTPINSRASSVEPFSESGSRKRRHVELISDEVREELRNVAANHIAFSRQSAVPFASVRKANSTLQSLAKFQVREIIRSIPCIGVIEGGVEDTTGRKAEDEYYYDLEKDDNEERRRVVQSTKGHRSLRNCRKTPKQYFYRPLNLG